MPYVKGFVSNFTDSMNMEEELADLDLRGDGIDLLGCECLKDLKMIGL